METLKNHQILFDAECPMCRLYTKSIVRAGILDNSGRVAYQQVTDQACPMLDRQRAVNEIALINYQTGEVTYGIHSLFKVIGVAVPSLRFLFSFKPFIWLMTKIYAFISYNRRVIIPAQINADRFQLQPTFKLGFRVAYIVLAWLATGYILSAYAKLLVGIVPHGGEIREYFICGGQILFQGFVILIISKNRTWAYLGNMMTISLAGALLLLPVIGFAGLFGVDPLIASIWFLVVAGMMLLEHARRCKLLEVGWILTVSWILYRVAILLFINLK